MNGLGATILVVLVLAVLFSPRRWALQAMMAGVLYLTESQQIDVSGFNLFAVRFLELAGFIRVMVRHEFSFRRMNTVDHALLWLYLYSTVLFLLRSSTGQAYQIGIAVDASLSYFTFRGLVGNMDDFRWFLRTFILLLAPYAFMVVSESLTGHNPFTILGGDTGIGWVRHERPRCFGSFRQPDTLGMFAASFIPLYIGMACVNSERKRSLLGIFLCLLIVWAANSGGETAAAVTGLVGWGFWRVRTDMRKVRGGIVAILVALTLVMNAPVWYIFAHISSITGGDGWHRSYLIDVAYRHLSQWWLAGMPTSDTADWFAYVLVTTGAADITNQFIAFGLNAGLGAIVLFVLLLTRAFSNLGRALAAVRSSSQKAGGNEFLLWGLGIVLVVHIINWFGITYFDQMYLVWFMQLAAISTLSDAWIKETVPQAQEVAEPAEGTPSLATLAVGDSK
jgi:hypothetical protein